MKSLRRAIRDNQSLLQIQKLLRRLRLRIFEYEDMGRLEKAQQVIERIKLICGPTWGRRKSDWKTRCWSG